MDCITHLASFIATGHYNLYKAKVYLYFIMKYCKVEQVECVDINSQTNYNVCARLSLNIFRLTFNNKMFPPFWLSSTKNNLDLEV